MWDGTASSTLYLIYILERSDNRWVSESSENEGFPFYWLLVDIAAIDKSNVPTKPECLSRQYEALTVGCNKEHEMEFKSACAELGVAGKLFIYSWLKNFDS